MTRMSTTKGTIRLDSRPIKRKTACKSRRVREEKVTTLTTKVDDEAYHMEHPRRGMCVVINQKNFAKHTQLEVRTGTDLDAFTLKTTFERLSFEVHVRTDLDARDFDRELKYWSEYDHSNCDAFVLCMLTHGERDLIYHTEGKMSIDKLFERFCGENCRSLFGKPKVFFIQACRGDSLDKGALGRTQADSANGGVYRLPSHADFLIAYSTVPGFRAWRNSVNGSWFIQALCKVLGDEYLVLNNDILSLLTHVNRLVAFELESKRPGDFDFDKCKQVPCVSSTLTRQLYLVPQSADRPIATHCSIV